MDGRCEPQLPHRRLGERDAEERRGVAPPDTGDGSGSRPDDRSILAHGLASGSATQRTAWDNVMVATIAERRSADATSSRGATLPG